MNHLPGLSIQLECICTYEDKRLPYQTQDFDYLCQLKIAVKVGLADTDQILFRESYLFEDTADTQESLSTIFSRAI